MLEDNYKCTCARYWRWWTFVLSWVVQIEVIETRRRASIACQPSSLTKVCKRIDWAQSDSNLGWQLLDKLLPGDIVLADRGFDIADSVGLHCARITIPASTKAKKQLTGIEVEQTRCRTSDRCNSSEVHSLTWNPTCWVSYPQRRWCSSTRQSSVCVLCIG